MKKNIFIFFFMLFVVSCNTNNKLEGNYNKPTLKVVKASGYVVPKDSIAEPVVIPVDDINLKKISIGKQTIVPANLNVHPLGQTKVVLAGRPRICTPGTDTFLLPKVTQAVNQSNLCYQPKPILASPMRMKDDATYNIQYLDVDQGMNSSYIRSFIEDSKGNLWFATLGEGVSKYDGKYLTHFTEKQGLSGNWVLSILEDSKGNIWFGTDVAGACKYDGKKFTRYSKTEGMSHNTINSIMEDKLGNIWFGTQDGGVNKFDGRNFTHFTVKEGLCSNYITCMTEDNNGNIWFGTWGGGVSKYDGSKLERINVKARANANNSLKESDHSSYKKYNYLASFSNYSINEGLCNMYITSIIKDASGNLWFGSDGGGVSKFDGKSFINYTVEAGLSSNDIWSILEDTQGNLWFGSWGNGVCKFNGINFTNYSTVEGLSNNIIRSMLEDKSGNIWFATEGGGINKFDERSFKYMSGSDGLSGYSISSMIEDNNSDYWFISKEGDLNKFDGINFTHISKWNLINKNSITYVFEDKYKNLWFGTNSEGVIKFDRNVFTFFRDEKSINDRNIFTIFEDRNNHLWFGTSKGVTMYDGKTFVNYTEKSGLSSNHVMSILQDKKGNLWFGTDGGGLTKFDGVKFTHFNSKQNLSKYIVSMVEDVNGNIWFGTIGDGLMKYDGENFTFYNDENGLCNNTIWSLVEDKINHSNVGIWLGTDKGLSYFNPKTCVFINFHKDDGLKADDFFRNSVLKDSKNRIWWGSGKALTMLDLNKFKLNENPPSIQLSTIYLQENFIDYNNIQLDSSGFGKSISGIKFSDVPKFQNYPVNLELPYNINHLTFQFSAIDWHAPHKLKYQYKLEGLDPKWSELTQENKADYRNIPYGKYIFKVKAIGSANKWSKTFAYEFAIHPPWWHTTWFRVIYSSCFILLLFFLFRWRTASLIKQKEILEKTVEERTAEVVRQKEIIEEKHKEITDSINYAERIQRSFLATHELLDENLKDYFVLFQPKEAVSGDFYWAHKLQNGNFAYVCADSTGHGVPGAIMSILNISSLEKSVETKNEPADILNQTRKIIIDRLKKDGSVDGGKDGMDCALIVLNKERTTLSYAAANNPVWVVRKGEIIELDPEKMPVGKHDRDQVPFTQHVFDLQKDDLIYALTDGMPDQFGGTKGKKYKYAKLKEFLITISTHGMAEQKEKLILEFNTWKGELEQIDDVTLIGVRV